MKTFVSCRPSQNGFTLVEIMIVVAILALIAGIAMPNFLKARIMANDTLAKSTLHSISTASETFSTSNGGSYPLDITSLTGATPAYINATYCNQTISGYHYTCNFTSGTYTITADPIQVGKSGTTTYTIITGGVLSP